LVFRRNLSSQRNRARKNRRQCNSILIRQLRRPQRRHKKNAHEREHSGERTPLACWFRRSAETIFHLVEILDE
jgi:hypothetical protein